MVLHHFSPLISCSKIKSLIQVIAYKKKRNYKNFSGRVTITILDLSTMWHIRILVFSYFCLQIGSFFMINLCLVVIATQFSETKKREMERMRLERARFQSSSTLASSTNNSEPTSCYAEIVKYIAHLWRRSKRRLLKKFRLYKVRRDQRREKKILAGETIHLNYNRRHHPNCPRIKQNVSIQI